MKHFRYIGFTFTLIAALVILSGRIDHSSAAFQTSAKVAISPAPASVMTLSRLAAKTITNRFHEPSPIENELSALEETIHAHQLLPDGHLRILTTELPVAYLKQNTQMILQAAGGMPPYHFEMSQGDLPEGISFDETNGVFFGETREEWAESVTVRVTDQADTSVQKEFLLIARNTVPETENSFSLSSLSFPKAIVGKYYYQALPIAGGKKPYHFEMDPKQLPPGLQFHWKEAIVYGQPVKAGTYSFSVDAKDAEGNVQHSTYEIEAADSPLYLTSARLDEGWIGLFYHARLEALGGHPGYHWQLRSGQLPKGLTFYPDSGVIFGIPLKPSDTKLVFSVTDSEENFDSAELTLAIHDSSLEIIKGNLPAGTVGQFYYFHMSSKGGEPPYRWEMSGKLPKGLTFQKDTGVFSGVPAEKFNGTMEVTVMDQAGNRVHESFRLPIIEKPLTLHLISYIELSVGEFYFFHLECEGGTPEYTWDALSVLPDGLALLPTGFLIGTPSKAEQMVMQIRVHDKTGESVSDVMIIQVLNESLAIQTISLNEARLNEPYYVQFLARGGHFPYLWSISGAPGGLFLNPESGVFSGVPSQAGHFSLAVQLRDSANGRVAVQIPWTVLSEPLQIANPNLPDGTTGISYQVSIEAKGGERPYVWNMTSGGLPNGLLLDLRTGLISGRPTRGENASFEIQVTDQNHSRIQKAFHLNITGSELRILSGALPEGTVSETYHFSLAAEGGNEPYRWTISSGSLPASLSLASGTGILSGVPSEPGSYSLNVRLQDANNQDIEKPMFLRIQNGPLTLHTGTLPSAHVNEPYHFTFDASGGETPYRWAITNGELPTGLQLDNGRITGTPSEAFQERSFTIQLTDHRSTHLEQPFTLSVEGSAPPSIQGFVAAPSDAKVGLAWQIPNDSAVREVRLFRRARNWPDIETDSPIYIGMNDQFLDTGLVNGEEYFYLALTYNPNGVHSEISSATQRSVTPNAVTLTGPNDPYADAVVSFAPLSQNAFGAAFLPGNVLGPPSGMGNQMGQASWTQVVSLNARSNNDNGASAPYGGSIILEFTNNIIVNGPGFDFTIFENAFFVNHDGILDPADRYMEPAVVSVSQDGVHYYDIPFDYVPHYDNTGAEVMNNPLSYHSGFAGIEPVYSNGTYPDPTDLTVSGGDHFDLSSITSKDLLWIKYVKIKSTGDRWLVDENGDLVRHTGAFTALSGVWYSGFDLDAVSAIHY